MAAARIHCLMFCAILVPGVPVAAAGYGGKDLQLEAFGTLAATFLLALRTADECAHYPSLRADSLAAAETYGHGNAAVIQASTRRLERMARRRGGQDEYRRLRHEILAAVPTIERQAILSARNMAIDEHACRHAVDLMLQGALDLRLLRAKEIGIIFKGHEEEEP